VIFIANSCQVRCESDEGTARGRASVKVIADYGDSRNGCGSLPGERYAVALVTTSEAEADERAECQSPLNGVIARR